MTPEERAQFAEALRFALEAHGEQKRRGTQIPYISHLVQVAGLVLEHGGDVEQAIAGLLHDVADDFETGLASTIGECFGPEVARIVYRCTGVAEDESGPANLDSALEPLPGPDPAVNSAWASRKKRYLDHLQAADARVKLVAACDKLDNLRSLLADLHAEGSEALSRFHGTPEQMRWYYQEVTLALGSELPPRLLREIEALTHELGSFVEGQEPGRSRRPGSFPASSAGH